MKFNNKTAKKMGKKGGKTNLEKYGRNYFVELANKKWKKATKNEKQNQSS